jgi:hypothetical protein
MRHIHALKKPDGSTSEVILIRGKRNLQGQRFGKLTVLEYDLGARRKFLLLDVSL